MKIEEYKSALKAAFSDKSTLFKGFLLGLSIPVIGFVTNPIGAGYFCKAGAGAMRGEKKLPQWKDFPTLWVNFVIAGLAFILYFVVPILIVLGLGFVFSGFLFENLTLQFMAESLGKKGGFEFSKLAPLDYFMAFIVFFPFFYIFPVAIINWFSSKRLINFFDLSLVWGRAFRKEYFITFIIATLSGLIVPVTLWMLSFVFDYRELLQKVIDETFSQNNFVVVMFVGLVFIIVTVAGSIAYGFSLFSMIVCLWDGSKRN